MITSMPASIAERNGGRSWVRQSVSLRSITGSPTWLSSFASPWPGKCFAAADTRWAARPEFS